MIRAFRDKKTGNSTGPATCATGVSDAPNFVRLHIGHCSVCYIEPEAQKLMAGDLFKLDGPPVKRQIAKVSETLMFQDGYIC